MRVPRPGEVKTRLVPPLDPEGAAKLYLAFLHDLSNRIRASRLRATVFVAGGAPEDLGDVFPAGWARIGQHGGSLGERLEGAFAALLTAPGARAVVMGSDSPDLPLGHVKRAFRLLKHRDVVLGPALDGGYYLVGLRAPAPALFRDIPWGSAGVFDATVRAARAAGLSLALTPPWYDVDDAAGLAMLRALCHARRLAGGERLVHTERALSATEPAGD